MRILFFCLGVILFFSCEKKELPAPKYERGDVITNQVNMTSNYKNQIWFSLSENKIESTNHKTDWDLGFECSANGTHIILNSSLGMRVYKTNHAQLLDVTDTIGLAINGIVDSPTGNLDSTAIGNWQNDNNVYVIDRGYSETGQGLGYYKLKITTVSASQFLFEYADVFGTQIHQGVVNKNAQYNFIAYSFQTHQQLFIEPIKLNYDLCFTQYTHVYINPIQYYQVTGVLTNSNLTRVLKITDKLFNDIVISDTIGRLFSNNKNSIGFDWKTFDFNTSLFTVNPSYSYIIIDSKGFYYKLHFIDFYNSSGIKGYPTFEYKKL